MESRKKNPHHSSERRAGGSKPAANKGDAAAAAAAAASSTESTAKSNKDSSALEGILSKLRPFQQEAFEFATEGRAFQRQWASTTRNAAASSQQQRPSFEYDPKLIGRGKILLADEMGLGKTVTSLAIMTAYMDEWPLLILCPASLRHTWPCEIEKFLPSLPPSAVYVVQGFDDVQFLQKRKQVKIVVATYSLLQKRSASARALQEFGFECVIADESHNLKERTSQKCQLAMPLLQNANRLLLLSGTPALARPVELWAQVSCLAPKLFGSYSKYTKQYCNARRGRFGWDVSGLSNAAELHDKLRQVMVRRLKTNVLKELPPKQRSIVPVKISQSFQRECQDLMEQLKQTRVSVDELVGRDAQTAHYEARRLLMAGYQASGIGKCQAVSDYLLDWLAGSGTQKILVFGHHMQVLDTMERAVAKKYKGVGHVRIDGSVPSKERALRVRKFQTNSRVRVAVLGMTAAGVGLTLTAASSVLFAELHWTPGVLAQAEDRCHRIGQQHNAVNVMYCICKDSDMSVDMKLWAMLGRKVGTLGRVIDGCKGASMDAKDVDPASMRNGSPAGGESAEDELVRFFAETSAKDSSQAKSTVPAKGSIRSFFKPKAAAASSTQPESDSSKVPSNAKAATATKAAEAESAVKFVTWACSTCTFENMKQKAKSGWLACEMCGTQYIQNCDNAESSVSSVPETLDNAATKSLQQEPIVIDIDAEEMPKTKPTPGETIIIDADDALKTAGTPNAAVVDVDEPDSKCVVTPAPNVHQKRKREPKDTSVLHFSVSINSGRVLFHSATSGEPLCHGFDIDQVLTEESSDALLSASMSRNAGHQMIPMDIQFCNKSVLKVISELPGQYRDRKTQQQCCAELKSFVSAYLSLREVEKKAFKKCGQSVPSRDLRKAVAKLMATAVCEKSTERYTGGAKERAQKKLQDGLTPTKEDMAVLDGTACAWCAKPLPATSFAEGVDSTYCSQSCAEQGRLGRGGVYASTSVRAQVFELEGGVCQICGIDAHAIYVRICSLQPAERLSALCNAKWRLPTSSTALERLLHNPKEGDFWQADHILAVAEGGGSCGLENLRTLCSPCHKVETDKLSSRLRLARAVGDQEHASGGKKQMDIRLAFFKSDKSKHSNNAEAMARKRPRTTGTSSN